MKLLITDRHILDNIDAYQDFFQKNNIDAVTPKIDVPFLDEEAMYKLMDGVDVCICGDDVVSEKVLQKGSETGLKFIMRWGIGVDSIDLQAAKKCGVKVFNNPDVFGHEVADLALALLLSICRKLPQIDKTTREGKWAKPPATSLNAMTVGVIGQGNIGSQIVKRLLAFGCTVKVYSRSASSEYHVPLDELISSCDAIIPACPLTAETRHLINADTIKQMKDGVIIVNIARGPVIDEKALVEALNSGKVSAAGLDVFEKEPVEKDNPLLKMDNVIVTAHIGSNTKEAVEGCNQQSLDKAVYIFENPAQTKYKPVA